MFISQLSELGRLFLATEQSETAHLRPQGPDLGLITRICEAAKRTPTSVNKSLSLDLR